MQVSNKTGPEFGWTGFGDNWMKSENNKVMDGGFMNWNRFLTPPRHRMYGGV